MENKKCIMRKGKYNMFIPEIPDNSITDRIKTIIELGEEMVDRYGDKALELEYPILDDEIEVWEKEHDIVIPDSYKEWLHFSKKSTIRGIIATFYEPKEFVIDNDKKAFDVPDDCVVIGELGGWGVSVCFYKENGEIMYVDHGEECRHLDFGDILDWVIEAMEELV